MGCGLHEVGAFWAGGNVISSQHLGTGDDGGMVEVTERQETEVGLDG